MRVAVSQPESSSPKRNPRTQDPGHIGPVGEKRERSGGSVPQPSGVVCDFFLALHPHGVVCDFVLDVTEIDRRRADRATWAGSTSRQHKVEMYKK